MPDQVYGLESFRLDAHDGKLVYNTMEVVNRGGMGEKTG